MLTIRSPAEIRVSYQNLHSNEGPRHIVPMVVIQTHALTVVLLAVLTLMARSEPPQAAIPLRADAHAVAHADVLDVLAHAHRLADDLVAHRQRVRRVAPAVAQEVQVAAAHAAVRDLDVDVVLLPRLGLDLLPDHLALHRAWVVGRPALELVVCCHCVLVCVL